MIRKIIIISTACLLGISVHAQDIISLEKCKALALENNSKAQNSQLSLEAARQTKKEAFTKYFPSISGTGTGFIANRAMMSMEMDVSSMMAPMMSAFSPAIEWAMTQGAPIDPDVLEALNNGDPMKIEALKKGVIGAVMAMQPIFAGGQIINGNKLAKIGVEVAELQKTMSDDEITLTVEQYYWQIVALEEKTKTIAEAEILLNRVHTDVKNAMDAGLINRNDLLKVELKQNELESGKLKLANGLKLIKMVLSQFIGLSSNDFEVDKSLIENVSLTLNTRTDHSSVLQQRTEYRLLEKSIKVGELQVKMETGKHLPTVAVGAGWNYMSFDKGSSSAMKQDFGMVFATVSVPISDWWGGSYAIKKQKLQVKIAENDKRNAEEMLLIQMQQLWNDVEEAAQQVQLADKAIASALENVRLNTDYYEAGTSLLTDLLDAQNTLQQARDQHTEAATLYCVRLAKYRQVTGQ
jgi:outer membrane protein TolC